MRITMVLRRSLLVGFLICGMYGYGHADDSASATNRGIPPKLVADYIHAVIEADRTLYTTHVVERMQDHGIVIANETIIKAISALNAIINLAP